MLGGASDCEAFLRRTKVSDIPRVLEVSYCLGTSEYYFVSHPRNEEKKKLPCKLYLSRLITCFPSSSVNVVVMSHGYFHLLK
jgi:hypothetical protein